MNITHSSKIGRLSIAAARLLLAVPLAALALAACAAPVVDAEPGAGEEPVGAAEEAITPNCPDNPYCAEVCESVGRDWRGWCNLSTGACTCMTPSPNSAQGPLGCSYAVTCSGSVCHAYNISCVPYI
ncbi:MAG: hypothetical protein QM820_34395 [Minicystis sp.]